MVPIPCRRRSRSRDRDRRRRSRSRSRDSRRRSRSRDRGSSRRRTPESENERKIRDYIDSLSREERKQLDDEIDRTERSLICMQLSVKLRDKDLLDFFMNNGVLVREARIITDRSVGFSCLRPAKFSQAPFFVFVVDARAYSVSNTVSSRPVLLQRRTYHTHACLALPTSHRNSGRSKGIAYVELLKKEDMATALGLSGQKIFGVPIVIQYSQVRASVFRLVFRRSARHCFSHSRAGTWFPLGPCARR